MIIDDAKVQKVFNQLTGFYEKFLSVERYSETCNYFYCLLMFQIGLLVDLGIEPDKKYPWAQWYYVVKNQKAGNEDRYAMPDLPPMEG